MKALTQGHAISLAEIRRQYEAREPILDIAARAKCSRNAIYDTLRAMGVTRRRDGAPSQAADRARQNVPLILELYAAGVSSTELQSAFGCDVGTLLTILREHGETPRPGGGRSNALLRSAVEALGRHDLLDHASRLMTRSQVYRDHAALSKARSAAEDERLGVPDTLAGPPLAAALIAWCAANGLDRSDLIGGETIGAWKADGGRVRAATADRWITHMEKLWWDVYDQDDPEARRYFEGSDEPAPSLFGETP